jgi:hypothetical protein
MYQIIMTIDTFFLISRFGIQHRTVGQHGTALIWHVEQIAVAFLALPVIKSGIGIIARFFPVVFTRKEMYRHVLDAMVSLCKEKVEGVLGGWQVAIHAIDDNTGGIVGMA